MRTAVIRFRSKCARSFENSQIIEPRRGSSFPLPSLSLVVRSRCGDHELRKSLEMLVSKLSGRFQQFVLVSKSGYRRNNRHGLLLAKLAKNLSLQLLGRISPTEEVNRLLGALVFLSLFTAESTALGWTRRSPQFLAGAGILALAVAFPFQTSPPTSATCSRQSEDPFKRVTSSRPITSSAAPSRISLRSTEPHPSRDSSC